MDVKEKVRLMLWDLRVKGEVGRVMLERKFEEKYGVKIKDGRVMK